MVAISKVETDYYNRNVPDGYTSQVRITASGVDTDPMPTVTAHFWTCTGEGEGFGNQDTGIRCEAVDYSFGILTVNVDIPEDADGVRGFKVTNEDGTKDQSAGYNELIKIVDASALPSSPDDEHEPCSRA